MQTIVRIIAVSALCAALAASALAGPIYEFRFEQSAYEVLPGGTVEVKLYLYETRQTDTSPGDMYLPDGSQGGGVFVSGLGIQQAGARVSFVPGTDNNVALTNIAGNLSLFDDFEDYSSSELGGGNAVGGLLAFLDGYASEGVLGDLVDPGPPDSWRVLVGTFTFTAPTGDEYLETVSTIRAEDLFAETDDTMGWDYTVLDSGVQIGTMATITVVPEPSSVVAISGLAVMGMLFWSVRTYRRRFQGA